MRATLIPLSDTLTPENYPRERGRINIDIFSALGTSGCLLDCPDWHRVHAGLSKIPGPAAPAKQKLRGIRGSRGQFRLDALQASADAGCGSCRFFAALIRGVLSASPTPLRRSATFPASPDQIVLLEWLGYAYALKISFGEDRAADLVFQFLAPSVPGGEGVSLHKMPSSNRLVGDTSSVVSMGRAKAWLKECIETHPACGSEATLLPQRLVEITLTGDAAGRKGVRLVTTAGNSGSYACLSHCWGGHMVPVMTTRDTIAQNQEFIPWEKLPRTFREAAEIATELGLDYIWIDSLCIIQDDHEDWFIQAKEMSDIYRNATVVIAAVASGDSGGGCYQMSSPDIYLRVEDEAQSLAVDVMARDSRDVGYMSGTRPFGELFPLLTRAWVLQERMLSRRVLFYTRNEVQFQCRSKGSQCECGTPNGAPHFAPKYPGDRVAAQTVMAYSSVMLDGDGALRKRDKTQRDACREVYAVWQRTVTEFSKLKLTCPEDRLPAILGCAKDFATVTGDDYIAGLWRENLARDLLWVVEPPVSNPRTKVWRAPTWSWASVDAEGGIRFLDKGASLSTTAFDKIIRHVECRPSHRPGELSREHSFIELHARLLSAYLHHVCRRCRNGNKGNVLTIATADSFSRLSRNVICALHVQTAGGLERVQGLELRGGVPNLHLDVWFEAKDNVKMDSDEARFLDNGHRGGCEVAPVSLLPVFDVDADGAQTARRGPGPLLFLVLVGCDGAGVAANRVYRRIGLLEVVHKTLNDTERWLREICKGGLGEERLIKLV